MSNYAPARVLGINSNRELYLYKGGSRFWREFRRYASVRGSRRTFFPLRSMNSLSCRRLPRTTSLLYDWLAHALALPQVVSPLNPRRLVSPDTMRYLVCCAIYGRTGLSDS